MGGKKQQFTEAEYNKYWSETVLYIKLFKCTL